MDFLKSNLFLKEFNDTFNGHQLQNLQKEHEAGNSLYVIGLQLPTTKSMDALLPKLHELETFLSKIDQPDCRLLNWALQPSMIALLQH